MAAGRAGRGAQQSTGGATRVLLAARDSPTMLATVEQVYGELEAEWPV